MTDESVVMPLDFHGFASHAFATKDASMLLLSARLLEIEEMASEMEFCRVILGLLVQIDGRGFIGPDPSHGARLVGFNGNLGL